MRRKNITKTFAALALSFVLFAGACDVPEEQEVSEDLISFIIRLLEAAAQNPSEPPVTEPTPVVSLSSGDSQPGDEFGAVVNLDSDMALVSAPKRDGNVADSGAVFVFKRNAAGDWANTWTLFASDAQADDAFGVALGLKNGQIIVGATLEDGGSGDVAPDSGAAYIFEPDGNGNVLQTARLFASDRQAGDEFGTAAVIGGGVALVSAPLEDGGGGNPAPDSGAVYAYKQQSNGTWTQLDVLRKSGTQKFGRTLALDGNILLVGAEDQVIVYELGSDEYFHEVSILPGLAGEDFGRSLALRGNTALVGAPQVGAGRLYLYQRSDAGVWSQSAVIQAAEGQLGDGLGRSAALDDDYILTGAPYQDGGVNSPVPDAGLAYAFARLSPTGAGEALTPATRIAGEAFGCTVALSGGLALVGGCPGAGGRVQAFDLNAN